MEVGDDHALQLVDAEPGSLQSRNRGIAGVNQKQATGAIDRKTSVTMRLICDGPGRPQNHNSRQWATLPGRIARPTTGPPGKDVRPAECPCQPPSVLLWRVLLP